MKSNSLIVFLLLFQAFYSSGQSIHPDEAATVACNFYFERFNLSSSIEKSAVSVQQIKPAGSPSTAYYICNMKPDGFVIVSATDKVIPVLAYSFKGSYGDESNLKEGFKVWMNHYQEQILLSIDENTTPPLSTKNEWHRLLAKDFTPNTDLKQTLSVSPLLVSKWDQDVPYNNDCPPDPAGPGGHCLTGCVATAMGQLLYYYRFPQTGQGSYSYNHPDYGTISADFGATTYQWDGMPSSTFKDCNPLGLVLFHQGVSVDMDYGPDGSGMWNHKAAYSLKNHFRYGPETRYFFRDSTTLDWDSLLVTNLNARKPLYYAGWAGVQSTSGHAFVCDGYQPGNYYHFNWGWGGSQDGYFYTANLTPGGNNFNFAQEVIPMFPDTLQNSYPLNCQGNTIITHLRGSVEDGSGWYNYQNNLSCSWLIAPSDPEYDSIKSLKLTFLKLDIDTGADTLYLYDGVNATAPLIGKFTGSTIPGTITSTGNRVFIKFITNSSIGKDGWQLDFESILPVYCSGTTILTESYGEIDDGSGLKNYNSNSVCKWKITPTSGLPVTLAFNSFNTFDSQDNLKVYDLVTQELLGNFSGNQIPSPVTALSGKMYLIFTTNSAGNADGWSGYYYASGVGLKEDKNPDNEPLIYPNPTSGNITIDFSLMNSREYVVHITDVQGNKLQSKEIDLSEGTKKIYIDLGPFPGSAYFLLIEDCEHKIIKKIILKE